LSPTPSRIVRWAPAVLWMAVIFILSAQPGLAVSHDPAVELPIRRVAHASVFALLTLLIAYAVRAGQAHRRLLAAGVLAAIYGLTDELHQATVPTRYFELEDIAFDSLGAVAAVMSVLVVGRLVSR